MINDMRRRFGRSVIGFLAAGILAGSILIAPVCEVRAAEENTEENAEEEVDYYAEAEE